MTIPPLATITGPLTYPGNSRAVASRSIRARCVGPEGAVLRDSGGGMVGETTVFTDAGGDFSLDLTLNSDIDEASGVGPPGTYWALTVGVTPAVSWHVRLDPADAGSSVVIGDAAHTIVDPTPRGWVPIQGEPGALPASLEAARPSATTVPAGTRIFATDSTTTWESDGASWRRRGRPTVEHVWSRDGITGWSQASINPGDSGADATTPGVLSVVGGRGRITRAATSTNEREAWLREGTLWEDSAVYSPWWGPPTWAAPQTASQAGHIHRAQPLASGSGMRGVVVTWNVALGVIWQVNVGVWNSTTTGGLSYRSYGSNVNAGKAFPMFYEPQIRAVERKQVGGIWKNLYYVEDSYRYEVGDKVQVQNCLDATFNATSAGAALTVSNVTSRGPGQLGTTLAIIETSTPQTAAVTKKAEIGKVASDYVNTATTPKWISPVNVGSRVTGTDALVKVWRVTESEPDWTDPSVLTMDFSGALIDSGGVVPVETPVGPGLCGLVSDHLYSGGWLEFGDFRAERL